MAFATSSLPVPLSPWISTGTSAPATAAMRSNTAFIAGLPPIGDLVFELPELEEPVHGNEQLLVGEGLGQVIEGPVFDGLYGAFDLGVGGDDDHAGLGSKGLRFPEDHEPVMMRKPEIGDDEVEAPLFDGAHALGPVFAQGHGVSLRRQALLHAEPHDGVVVDDKNAFFHNFDTGNFTVNVVPCPDVSTEISPPCCSTMALLTVRPRPVPSPTPFVE